MLKRGDRMNEILIAKDRMWFYNGETIAKEVHIGKYDSPENWRQITEEEKNEIEKESEEQTNAV